MTPVISAQWFSFTTSCEPEKNVWWDGEFPPILFFSVLFFLTWRGEGAGRDRVVNLGTLGDCG